MTRGYRTKDDPFSPGVYSLTETELEILRLLCQGLSAAEIAHARGTGRTAVDGHRANIREKLGAETHADAVRIARERGLV